MITFQKYLIYILGFLMMAGLIIFMPDIANTSAIFFQTIIGAFLGIDLASTIRTSQTLPEGQYKKLKNDRYIFAGVTNLILTGVSIYLVKVKKYELTTCISIFSSGVFVVLTTYIAGLESNKLVTFSDPGKNIGVETQGIK
jgi:hypothetical protein